MSSDGGPTLESLTPEQRRVYDLIVDGQRNLFITGGAGSGKTAVVRLALQTLAAALPDEDAVAATGTTGVAAMLLRGMTVHRFAGFTKEDKPPSHQARQRMQQAVVLPIEELSMMAADDFDKLDKRCRDARRKSSDRPFGGLRLILVGDFLQLPPVAATGYAFKAKVWPELDLLACDLPGTIRQGGDPAFAALLREVRVGRLSPASRALLEQRTFRDAEARRRELATKKTIVFFYSRKEPVEKLNRAKLDELPGEAVPYTARDQSLAGYDGMCDDTGLVKDLKLKVGAAVVLCRNIGDVRETGLFNGRPGRVARLSASAVDVAFPPLPGDATDEERVVGIVAQRVDVFVGKRVVASRTQIPLQLAWAQTVHRAQGQTVHAEAVVGRINEDLFAPGMAYVFLSRLRRLDQLVLEQFRPEAIRADPTALAFHDGLRPFDGATL